MIIINLKNNQTNLTEEFENFIIDLNKKVLIISKTEVRFKNIFLKRTEYIENSYLTYFNNDVQYGSKYILKRLIDILLSIIILLLTSPLFLFVILFVLLKDGYPVLIKQNRVGLHGIHFSMFKFRTMKKNAHSERDELKNLNEGKGPLFKIQNDPRIINGANFLRDYSLDELPQLFNVIKGDMSLVGPRPLFDDDTLLFEQKYMRRLNVLPGITGLLQINDRNTKDFAKWYEYDISYIENWTIYLDLKIIFLTPFAILKKNSKGF